jgi:hypothetical protein
MSLLYQVETEWSSSSLEGHDTVREVISVPTSLNINNLGDAEVLHFPLLWLGAMPVSTYR